MRLEMAPVPHVVIVGAGFGGLTAAKALGRMQVRVTVIDRTNHHLFQPLLYQVAMAGLSPAEIAQPVRSILSPQENTRVVLAEVERVDLAAREVRFTDGGVLGYDYLLLATGAKTAYFGHPEWERFAPGLKALDDAVEIRRRVLMAFERAEREEDEARRRELLTFVIIGAGPTGVEMAGAVAELAQKTISDDFRAIRPSEARVVLVEGGDRVLPAMPTDLSERAKEQLADLGVELRLGVRVTGIDEHGVDTGGERLVSATVVWAAGVEATPLTRTLGVPLDKGGRVLVGRDLALPGHPEAFAIGDMARFEQDGAPLPGISPVAMQQARFFAETIAREEDHRPRREFRYHDKGSMATIGRSRAVAQAGKIHLSGFLAWLAWLTVHIWYLIGFRSRLVVLITWAWSYLTYRRGARLITSRTWEPHSR
jgi:NADH:ubiquinone reductase (H+-translocating)